MPDAAVDRGRKEPAGRLTRRATKALLAALHPAGGLRRSLGHALALAGSLLPSGALTKRAQPVLAALLHPAAAIARQGRRTLLRSVAHSALGLAAALAEVIHRFGPALRQVLPAAARAAQFYAQRRTRGLAGAVRAALFRSLARTVSLVADWRNSTLLLARWAPTRAECSAPLT